LDGVDVNELHTKGGSALLEAVTGGAGKAMKFLLGRALTVIPTAHPASIGWHYKSTYPVRNLRNDTSA
jgi:hypothetical protein